MSKFQIKCDKRQGKDIAKTRQRQTPRQGQGRENNGTGKLNTSAHVLYTAAHVLHYCSSFQHQYICSTFTAHSIILISDKVTSRVWIPKGKSKPKILKSKHGNYLLGGPGTNSLILENRNFS